MAADARRRARAGVAAALLIAVAFAGCAVARERHSLGRTRVGIDALRPLLNSQRIEAIFGSYGVEVLEADARFRLASLYSLEGGRRICRTLALTTFPPVVDPRVAVEHQAILGGASIGATFAANGWKVDKRTRHIGEVSAEKASRVATWMELGRSRDLAAYAYSLVVRRDGVSIDYATLLEVYHPAFLQLEDLDDLLQGGTRPVPGRARPVDAEVDALLARMGAELR